MFLLKFRGIKIMMNNTPPVTKNLLIINVLCFMAAIVAPSPFRRRGRVRFLRMGEAGPGNLEIRKTGRMAVLTPSLPAFPLSRLNPP
jgi:hypothetical protein